MEDVVLEALSGDWEAYRRELEARLEAFERRSGIKLLPERKPRPTNPKRKSRRATLKNGRSGLKKNPAKKAGGR